MQHGCPSRPRRARSGQRTPATRPSRTWVAHVARPAVASIAVLALALGACATSPLRNGAEPVVTAPVRVIERRAARPAPDTEHRDELVVATGDGEARGDEARADHRTIDATLGALFERARTLVEAASGTDLSSVTLRLASDEAILAEVSVETRRLVRGQLGDGPLAERLLESLVRGQIGTYAALYAGRHRTVMVSRTVLASYLDSLPGGAASRDEALLVLMLHELVHAADDVRHDIHADRALDFRASFAQSAVYEGHAQWLTREICRREGCLGGLDALDAFMFDDVGGAHAARAGGGRVTSGTVEPRRTGTTGHRPSPLDRNLLEYSYVEGERFVAALAAREDGAALVQRSLAAPPHDPLQILDPESFPDTARERRNRRLLDVAANVDHPWTTGPDARVPVATSPLKGVDLRGDPARRAAAVDGFTRLVTAMVAVQFHDPDERARPPIEVTLMRTDRPDTARLFADTLHAHARLPGATVPRDGRAGGDASDRPDDADRSAGATGTDETVRRARLLRTELSMPEGDVWRTVVASGGHVVVQASGRTRSSEAIDAYVLDVLDALLADEPA